MRKMIFVFMLAAVCLLTGCTGLTGNTDTLMEPPRLMGEQQVVRDALQQTVGESIILAYPASGTYRDAVILHNFLENSDGNAVAFYKDQSQSVRIAVFSKDSGGWGVISDVSTGAVGIDFVDFCGSHLVVGLDLQQKEKQLTVYSFDNGPAETVFSTTYQAAAVTDLDEDGVVDLITVCEDEEEKCLEANFITRRGNEYGLTATTQLNDEITSVYVMTDGYTGDGVKGLFVDGKTGRDALVTQILLVENGTFKNVLFDDSATGATKRTQIIACQKGDYGMVEIPTLSLLPGYENAATAQYLTDWNTYRGGKLEYTRSSFISQSLGFSLDVPRNLRGKITFRYAYERTRVEILAAEGGSIEENQKLLAAIGIFTAEEINRSGFTQLGEVGTTVYGATTYGNASDPLFQTLDQLRQRFSLISW